MQVPIRFVQLYLVLFLQHLIFFSFRVDGKIDNFNVVGSKQEGTRPEIVMCQNKEYEVKYSLLIVKLEINPFDRKCDTRVIIKSRPLQIVYDAVSMECHRYNYVDAVYYLSLDCI